MEDRFKYRLYIEGFGLYPDSDENDEEYFKSFYLNKVCVYNDGGCGMSDDDLCDQLKEQGFTEHEIEQVRDQFYSRYDEWANIDEGIIEQCTGLKDKNGKLIYEGDIISFKTSDDYGKKYIENYTVGYNIEKGKWVLTLLYTNDEELEDKRPFCKHNLKWSEIIGTIHDQPEREG